MVGTTPDYVDFIRRTRPTEVLFMTAPHLRERSREETPAPEEEILCPLSDPEAAGRALRRHLACCGQKLIGVACYDCESLQLAAFLADRMGLPFPSARSVGLCRDKYLSQRQWVRQGLPCPRFSLAADADQALRFLAGVRAAVIKPLGGSGSELVFRVANQEECVEACRHCREGMFLIEELIEGEEYSCDFAVAGGKASVLRVTRKYPRPGLPFGTIEAYELLAPESAPGGLEEICRRAAGALEIEESICMLDLIVGDSGPMLLEMAPRPGGACLPLLLRTAGGRDTIGRVLDWAAGRPDRTPFPAASPLVGLVLHSPGEGRLARLDLSGLTRDPRVLALEALRREGDEVRLPPRDYDTWQLAQLVYRPEPGRPVPEQNRELAGMWQAELEEQ